MTNLSGGSNPPNLTLPVHTLRKDRERKENKCILATCAIGRRINVADSFVGTGSLVKEFFENCDQKIHLIASEKVFSSDDLSSYFLWFKKPNGGNKRRMGLLSICKRMIKKSDGLAFVPVDRNKFNFFRKRYSGILTHRPFTIRAEGKEGLRNSELCCHVVEESGNTFAIKPYQVMEIAGKEPYLTDQNSMKIESAGIYSHNRKGLGAPITITGENGIAKAVGAVTLGNNQQISFVLFLQIDRTRLPPDKREAEGGESQSSREPGIGGGEQPLGESVESSYRVGARKEGTQKYSADQYTSIQGASQTVQGDAALRNEPNMCDAKAVKQEKKIGHHNEPKEVAQRMKEDPSDLDLGMSQLEEDGSDDDRNQLEDVQQQREKQPKKSVWRHLKQGKKNKRCDVQQQREKQPKKSVWRHLKQGKKNKRYGKLRVDVDIEEGGFADDESELW